MLNELAGLFGRDATSGHLVRCEKDSRLPDPGHRIPDKRMPDKRIPAVNSASYCDQTRTRSPDAFL
jgi:hypothetical protein